MINWRRFPKKMFWRIFWAGVIISLILDFYWLYTHKFHFHFSFQSFPQFFALFGLFGCMALILIAKAIGIFIVKEEDYYHKEDSK